MSYKLTERAKAGISRENIEPNLVLLIDGYDKKLSVRITQKRLRYDEPGVNYDDGYLYDGLIDDSTSRDLISISGTTNNISHQLDPDKGAASSTQTLTLSLIDINDEITKLVTPGEILPEILYRSAKLYWGLNDSAFPDDYIQIFDGNILEVNPGVGTINLVITHPDDVKRSSVFQKYDTKLIEDLLFDSVKIGQITYVKRPDVTGSVSINYSFAGLGDDAVVSVIGNTINVQVDTAFTTYKTIKKKIENHEDANQLVTASITGNGSVVNTTTGSFSLSSGTTIKVTSAEGFLPSIGTLFKSYARINDEIIEIGSIDAINNELTGCTRQALTSFGSSHKVGDTVSTFYKLGDATNYDAIDLGLILLLSGPNKTYLTKPVIQVNQVPDVGPIGSSFYFDDIYLSRDHGVVTGDFVTTTGSLAGNNVSNAVITEVVETDTGSYITVAASLNTEIGASISCSFKSMYNLLDDGCNLHPSQVDIAQFRFIKNRYPKAIADYEFYIKDTVNVKDFINKQIFMPSRLYSIPRQGKVSVGITSSPIYASDSPIFTLENIKNPKGLRLARGVSKNFYNTIAYSYDQDSVLDKYLNKTIEISAESINRVDSPIKAFTLNADGLRDSNDTNAIITNNSRAFLDRYKYGAEVIKVPVMLKDGLAVEVGDSVVFGDPALFLPDTKTGTKDFTPRIMEVVNKEWNWVKGDIQLTLLDTTYSNTYRYGVFSPTSLVGSGSTTTNIVIEKSFGTNEFTKEKVKWQNLIGRTITIHTVDRVTSYSTVLKGFDPGNDNIMIVDPAIPAAPTAGWLVDIPNYSDILPIDGIYKSLYAFFDPSITLTNDISDTQFDVGVGDETKFFVGSLIRVHSDDYLTDSGINGKKVTNITGQTITCESLGFVPLAGMKIELIGFASDSGRPYAFV